MLKDTTTAMTFSSRNDAIRQLGLKEFKNKVKRDELIYILCQ